jgi:hypothetical protein
MRDQRRDEDVSVEGVGEEVQDNGVLNLMFLDSHSYPWTVEEIGREIHDQLAAVDSVCRLTEAGLLHRLGDFVFPTRTARRADTLKVGTV